MSLATTNNRILIPHGEKLIQWLAREKKQVVYRYRLTLFGFITLALIFITGFAAIQSGANLVYFLFGLLIATFITHGIVSPRNVRRLEIQRVLPTKVTAGQEARIILRIRNRHRFLPVSSLLISDLTDKKAIIGRAPCPVIPPGESLETSYSTVHQIFEKRGLVHFRSALVSSRFPFSFIERSAEHELEGEVIVLPRTYPIDGNWQLRLGGQGETAHRRRGPGIDLHSLREYIEGEPARQIHWKTSARARRLIVAEREREERNRIVITLVDVVPVPTDELKQLFERAVTLSASLALFLLRRGFDVGLRTSTLTISPRNDRDHADRILRALALVELHSGTPIWEDNSSLHLLVIYADGQAGTGGQYHAVEDARLWYLDSNVLRKRVTS
jgi:uncharacterized protein (DUF58 family)